MSHEHYLSTRLGHNIALPSRSQCFLNFFFLVFFINFSQVIPSLGSQ